MKFCVKCGKEMLDEAVVCTNCGCPVAPMPNIPNYNDAPSFGFALLGFFFPIVGLILWLVYKDTSPLKARSAGKGALVAAIIQAALYVLIIVFYILLIVLLAVGSAAGW